MNLKQGLVVAGTLIYGGTTIASAKSLGDLQSKLSDTNKFAQVMFATTSSQAISSAGMHAVQFPAQTTYGHYVKQIAEPLVMRNGGVTYGGFTSVSSGQVTPPRLPSCGSE
jgi:hypothetical protein